jgi:hypothetical protein
MTTLQIILLAVATFALVSFAWAEDVETRNNNKDE